MVRKINLVSMSSCGLIPFFCLLGTWTTPIGTGLALLSFHQSSLAQLCVNGDPDDPDGDGDECFLPPSSPSPPKGPNPPGGRKAGDPVDLASGTYTYQRVDLSIDDVIPVSITRTYEQFDNTAHSFGVSWTLSYDIFLFDPLQNGQEYDLVLSDNTRIPFTLQPDGSYRSTTSPDNTYYGATIKYVVLSTFGAPDGLSHYILTLKDQTQLRFPAQEYSIPLEAFRDRYGNTVELTRQQIWYTDSNGYQRVRLGHITRITSPSGRYIQLKYDSATNSIITQATDNSGRTINYGYDTTTGLLNSVIDADQSALPSSQQEPVSYQYYSSGMLKSITDKNTNIALAIQYYPDGRVQYQTMADGTQWQYVYSSVTQGTGGFPTYTRVTNPNGYVTEYDFDASGYVVKQIDAYGVAAPYHPLTTVFHRNSIHLVDQVQDPIGRYTTYTYDALGNIKTVTRMANTSEAATSMYVFDPIFSQLSEYTDELNKPTNLQLDYLGNPTTKTDALGNVWSFAWLGSGLLSQISSPMGNTTSFNYSNYDLTSVTDASGVSTYREVDDSGRTSSTTDVAGNVTTYAYDPADRLVNITDPLFNTISFGYDGNGNRTSVTLPSSSTAFAFGFDTRNNLKKRTDPLLHVLWQAAYDGDANLQSSADGKNQLTAYIFDPFDRPQEIDFKDGSSLVYTFDDGDRLTKIVDSQAGTTSIAPDDFDHPTSVKTPFGASVGYKFDSMGHLQTLTYPSGLQVTYLYDDAWRVKQVNVGATDVLQLTPDNDGRLSTLVYPNGAIRSNAFTLNHLSSIAYFSQVGKRLGTWNFGYDQAGRINSVSGSLMTAVVPSAMTATFDEANRIQSLNGASLNVDGNGSQLTESGLSFSYNVRNQLSKLVAGPTTATYGTNALGQRDTKTVNGVTTHYLYDTYGHLIAEVDANNITQREYVWIGDLPVLFRVYSAGTYSTEYNIWTDHLGTPRVLTDASNNIVWRWNSDAYGNGLPIGSITFNLRFPGQYYDAESGLHYNGARYYNPRTGRYLQADPLGFAAGWNTYAYAHGDPILFKDPTGRFGLIGAGIGAVSGAAAGYVAGGATGAVVGGIVGGLVGIVAPGIAGEVGALAGEGIAGMLANTGAAVATGAAAGGLGTVATNAVEGNPLGEDLGYGIAIGGLAPLASGEAFIIGVGGEEAVGVGAANSFSGLTGVAGIVGAALDPNSKHGFLPKTTSCEAR